MMMKALGSTQEKLFFTWTLFPVLSACHGTGSEPVSIGHYLIDNTTNFTLQLEADNTPFDEQVPPDTLFHFFTAEAGSGRSAGPHHIFHRFTVTAVINPTDSILYEGVYPQNSEDCEVSNTRLIKENPGTEYYPTIPR